MAKHFFLLIIRCYWLVFPEHKRRECIFSESCSRHVYRITKTKGFFHGSRAFLKRYKQCRPGYRLGYNSSNSQEEVILRDGSIVNRIDLREGLDIFRGKA